MTEPPREQDESLEYRVVIGLLEADLLLPLCHSLKDKRTILSRTLNHIRKHHPISVAEVAQHDLWGRAGIAAVTVSNDPSVAQRTLREVAHSLERDREVQLVNYTIQML